MERCLDVDIHDRLVSCAFFYMSLRSQRPLLENFLEVATLNAVVDQQCG
jgi:hypothetical protein